MLPSRQQTPDLNDIAVFDKVAAAGSFSVAARQLGLPRATVSRMVARLEDAIGAQLLYRTTRKVTLTEMGRTFHEAAGRGLALIGEAGEAIAAAKAEPSGLLRVTASVNFATMSFMPWLREFFAQHPKVDIALRLTDMAVNPLKDGADLAIVAGRLPDSSFLARRLATSRLILVASPEYLAGKPPLKEFPDASLHDFILFKSETGSETWNLEGREGAVDLEVSGRIGVSGPHAELSAALAGLGVALLPEAAILRHLDDGLLVRVLPDFSRQGGMISAVMPANRHQSAALRALLDFLVRKTRDNSGSALPASHRSDRRSAPKIL